MEKLKNFSKSEPLLIICEENEKDNIKSNIKEFNSAKLVTLDEIKEIEKSSQTAVISFVPLEKYNANVLKNILLTLKNGAKCIFANVNSNVSDIEFDLKTSGFINVEVKDGAIVCNKPNYDVGSQAKLNLKKPEPKIWKLDDEEEGTIDPDNLLDEDDLKKPDPTSLRVCGTTGKRKACKDCSCGLAEELATEVQTGKIVDTSNAPKSSCGSCYLGDAFRCATCPYLGMPAFKAGEKIQLAGNQLSDDI